MFCTNNVRILNFIIIFADFEKITRLRKLMNKLFILLFKHRCYEKERKTKYVSQNSVNISKYVPIVFFNIDKVEKKLIFPFEFQ